MNSYEKLDAKRKAFKSYNDGVVKQAHGLSDTELEKLGTADVAKRIVDPAIRRRYCELEIELLEANIAHHKRDLTILTAPRKTNSFVVASTLFVSGIAYQLGNPASALIAAAVWYWLANETASRSAQAVIREAEEHNELAPGWRETLQKWEAVRDELRNMLR